MGTPYAHGACAQRRGNGAGWTAAWARGAGTAATVNCTAGVAELNGSLGSGTECNNVPRPLRHLHYPAQLLYKEKEATVLVVDSLFLVKLCVESDGSSWYEHKKISGIRF